MAKLSRILPLLVTLLTLMVVFRLPPAFATQHEGKVTETLLSEGYNLSQSTVAPLLKMIEDGYSWDSMDNWMAYHNLERFVPYSPATSLKVLALVRDGISGRNHHLNPSRLLMGVLATHIQSLEVIEELRSLMLTLKASEDRLLLAVSLTKYASTRPEAIKSLYGMFTEFDSQPKLQILTAFNLLVVHEYVEEAEALLTKNLHPPGLANIVLLYAATSYFAPHISENLFLKMVAAPAFANESDRRLLQNRIRQTQELRRPKPSDSSDCELALKKANNVIPLRLKSEIDSQKK